jgi:hypothetical protein
MQAHGVPLREVEPAGLHDHLREASAPHDASSTAVIEALVIAALQALEAPVCFEKQRGEVFQESVEEVTERPTVTVDHRGTTPGDHQAPLGRPPRPGSHDPRCAANAGT